MTAAGEPVFYSGSKLAPDLSLPRLQQRWATLSASSTDDHGDVGEVCGPAAGVLEHGRDAMAAARRGAVSEDPHGIAEATAEVFTALYAAAGRHSPAPLRWWMRPSGTTGRLGRPAAVRSRWGRPGSGCGGWRVG